MICVCGGSVWALVAKREELSRVRVEMGGVEYKACERCGAIVKLPFPGEMELRAYYEGAWQYQSERDGIERAAEFIREGVRAPDGCSKFPLTAAGFVGNGRSLEVAAKGDAFARALAAAGLRMLGASGLDAQPQRDGIGAAWLGSGTGPEGSNALVVAAHVLEHVTAPVLFLADLLRLTAQGGYVYVEVPSLHAGQFDIGLCDDINRNHLWHFTLQSLVHLATLAGATVVRVQDDLALPGWPVLRLLLKKHTPARSAILAFADVEQMVRCEYEKAELALHDRSPKTTALYGASHSYAKIRALWKKHARRFQVYDRYKNGELWDGVVVRHPDTLTQDGIDEVFVTTRSINSYLDIKRDLYASHPWLLVHSLYPSITRAANEEAPPPAYVVP
jgi:hypothetical protein